MTKTKILFILLYVYNEWSSLEGYYKRTHTLSDMFIFTVLLAVARECCHNFICKLGGEENNMNVKK